MSAKASRRKGTGQGTSHKAPTLPFARQLFHAGERVCMAVSGGADSTALLRTLAAASAELGLVLSVIHVHHGIRGAEADADAAFVAELAAQTGLAHEVVRVDAPAYAASERISLETAARNLRYQTFRKILGANQADSIATAHTLDDQAETVMMKLLRGAWTEGISGIHPELAMQELVMQARDAGAVCAPRRLLRVVRPLLGARRAEIESYLHALGQTWREDASNRDAAHTRNRVRHHLLPALRDYNPNLDEQLARMATLARDEENYWQGEMARILPTLLLPGRPVRGGGRSVSTELGEATFGMDVQRLLAYPRAVQRRVLRAALEGMNVQLDFEHTEALLSLLASPAMGATASVQMGMRLQLAEGVWAERSVRELRFERQICCSLRGTISLEYTLPVPGEVEAVAFGLCFTASTTSTNGTANGLADCSVTLPATLPAAKVRAWLPGDRVMLPGSRGPKKVKEVLERMHVHGNERKTWPVVVWQERIVWMQGVRVVALADSCSPLKIEAHSVPDRTK